MSESQGAPPAELLLDFDGTLVEPNVAIVLLREFVPDGLRVAEEIDALLHRREITLREAWARESALLPVARVPEMVEFGRRHVPLRPGCHDLLALARRHRLRTAVISGGLDFYIAPVLEREGLQIPVFSDRAEVDHRGERLRVVHPHGHESCRLCGICKAQLIRPNGHRSGRTVFVGDGSTDRYAAEVADIVFARRRLAELCSAGGIPYFAFEGFAPVAERLERWLTGADPWPPQRAIGLADSACPISRAWAAPGR